MGRKADSQNEVKAVAYRAQKIFDYIVMFGPNKRERGLCDVSVVGLDLHLFGLHPDQAIAVAIEELKNWPQEKEFL